MVILGYAVRANVDIRKPIVLINYCYLNYFELVKTQKIQKNSIVRENKNKKTQFNQISQSTMFLGSRTTSMQYIINNDLRHLKLVDLPHYQRYLMSEMYCCKRLIDILNNVRTSKFPINETIVALIQFGLQDIVQTSIR